MHKPLLLLPAVVFLALGAASNSSAAPQEGSAKQSKTAGPSARVKELYKIDCALCHNDNGDGKTDLAKGMELTLSDLSDPKTLQGMTDEQLFDLIRKGKDKMPGEDAGRAKNEEIKGLIEYIRGFSKNAPTPAATPTTPPAPASSSAPSTPGSSR